MLKQAIKNIIPYKSLLLYHKLLAILANIRYGFPSSEMVVIGVTGTKGKSSTSIMVTRILEESGLKVGSMNTIFFKIAEKEWPNITKQGMQGRFKLQKMLRQMAQRGCTHVVIEVTSEGIAQHRQWGISFDVVVFTNLGQEHIEAHGSYEKYRLAKQVIFKELYKSYRKTFNKKKIDKIIIVNAKDPEHEYFAQHASDEKWLVHDSCEQLSNTSSEYKYLCANKVTQTKKGVEILINDLKISFPMQGLFMAENALLAIAVCQSLGISIDISKKALEKMETIPGRVELIQTKLGFKVVIDYAHEPKSFEAIFNTAKNIAQAGNIISVFGATGGGRDIAKRPLMGEIASKYSNYIILTNDDPYNDDEQSIIDDISIGISQSGNGWEKEKNWFSIIDRKIAIQKALSIAKAGDVVLLLGKGAEKVIVLGDTHVPWSDKAVVQDWLQEQDT